MELHNYWAQASAYFERSRQSNADYPPVHGKLLSALNNFGLELRSKQQLDAAAAQFRKALDYEPNYWQAHYNLGLVLSQQGLYRLAIAQFREALRLNPGYAEAKNQGAWAAYQEGLALAARGNREAALAAYRETLGFVPTHADALRGLDREPSARP
jgi:tetratricopeptide (TPR) repeat protein